MDENPKIFSKEWFWLVLVLLGLFVALLVSVLIFGDEVDEFLRTIFFGGFCFVAGIVFGLHRAKMMRPEDDKEGESNTTE